MILFSNSRISLGVRHLNYTALSQLWNIEDQHSIVLEIIVDRVG